MTFKLLVNTESKVSPVSKDMLPGLYPLAAAGVGLLFLLNCGKMSASQEKLS